MTDFLLLAFIFLIAGVAAVPIAARLGLGSVLGYLIAGILISPLLTILNVDVISIQHFAEFGVVMMLFLVGLELQPKMLWAMRAQLAGLGGGQVVLTTLVVMGAAMALGLPWMIGLTIGLIMSLSSTAIVLQSLQEKGLMKCDGGRASFSVLLSQDIAVIPMLALIPLLAMPELVGHGSEAHGDDATHAQMSLVAGLNGWQTALVNLGAIGAVVLGGGLLSQPIFRYIAAAQLRELFTATALMMVIGIALLMSLVGLSPALGTFLGGVVLANSPYRHELESDIDPFKGLLLGLFFMTVGASINFALLAANALSIIGLTLGLVAAKTGVLLLLGWIFKVRGANNWLMALGLAQAGEFAFVLLSFSVTNAVLPQDLADRLLLIVALSMLLTPALFILYDRVIAPRYATSDDRDADDIDEQNHIIIAGHGRVGGIVARMLRAAGHTPTVIDHSAKQLEVLSKFGLRAYYGDATRPDLLNAAGIAEAKLFVIAIDDPAQTLELVKYMQRNYPQVHVIARAYARDHVYDLWAAGCRDVIRETYDSSLRMGRSAFEALGASRENADAVTDAFDVMDRKSIIVLAEHHDPENPGAANDTYVRQVREKSVIWEAELNAQINEILKRA
ncbi:cation:proton antiporter [Cognatishimia sp. MH4019]|uniref:cation:proton antiporter domain-containing protein n=1 Tax=Cognatishimia sp. MH4019 TaxID=2854030 RepID=UPI001CD5DEA4|nr:cation:proton antiporter [Cognatishimia sp. MH4019]